MFLIALFIITKTKNSPNIHNDLHNRTWWAIKGNEAQILPTLWMKLKGIIVRKKPDIEGHLLPETIHRTIWKRQNHRNNNQISDWAGRVWLQRKRRRPSGTVEMFHILKVVMGTWCIFLWNSQNYTPQGGWISLNIHYTSVNPRREREKELE